ncbi:hypothetical protein [Lactobacillus ultunensis]|uniref:Uncharacterized protein n=1 Tax=Lactobacillus ultunensis DSM 16047 TaxID=525365 RepID=C2EPQ2_9LACO|nr:hypothetical protein [Lactobacillus ultunensis]EEJ71491.1 hypothetical protein HMPREF0548_1648 [Lactobacillus ultunensis DSM 16047]KRL80364.1 hypothetical protein FC57_GL001356 [Lactobacillus ultunensis DSM 16047]QQP28284.1 hypothetical protein H4B44_09330 [Lactobacillus ultunensis]
MKELEFNQDISQSFVNGTMAGFTDYVKRRNQDSRDLIVSRGGAWMKGNFIDNAVANEVKKLGNFNYQIKMAGYSWEYLQFSYYDKQSDIVNNVILKNYKTLTNSISNRNNKLPDYLAHDSVGNIDILKEHKEKIHATGQAVQLELLPQISTSKEKLSKTNSSRFYVVGYSLGQDGGIESLKLLMPNPVTNSLVEIEDWKEYIAEAPIQPNPDDLNLFQDEKNIPEAQYDDTSNMKYEIADNAEEKDN